MSENSQNPVLVELVPEMKDKFFEMAKEWQAAGENRFQFGLEDFATYIARLAIFAAGKNLPAGRVRENNFFLLAENKFVGSSNLRHELNDGLAVMGGHIGYDIRPSERRQGYGSLILQLTLEKARAIGLKRVFLTCDTDNTASAKIIEKHGGRLENRLIYEPTGKLISQYWIELP